jgi:hypothetical protein
MQTCALPAAGRVACARRAAPARHAAPRCAAAAAPSQHAAAALRRGAHVAPLAAASRSFVRHGVDSAACDVAVHSYPTPEAQAAALCASFEALAAESIDVRGVFTVAVPGGSVLKMLGGLAASKRVDWSKVVLAFANHKCVPVDADNSTYFKARKLFLDAAKGITVVPPSGGADPVAEAASYEARLRATDKMSFDKHGHALFDLMLLGAPRPRLPACVPCARGAWGAGSAGEGGTLRRVARWVFAMRVCGSRKPIGLRVSTRAAERARACRARACRARIRWPGSSASAAPRRRGHRPIWHTRQQ